MSPERRALVEHMLKTYTVRQIVGLLSNTVSGEASSYSQVDSVRRSLVKNSPPLPPRDRKTERPGPMLKRDAKPLADAQATATAIAAEQGCQALLDRTIGYYKRRGKELGMDWAEVGARLGSGIPC